MRTIRITIEKTENNYSAFINEINGIVATGETIEEIKKNMIEAIDFYIEACKEFGDNVPEILQDEYNIEFHLDAKSFLNIYAEIFSKSGLEKLTGINQKQLWHYAKGVSRPRPAQRVRIESALHRLGEELIAIHL